MEIEKKLIYKNQNNFCSYCVNNESITEVLFFEEMDEISNISINNNIYLQEKSFLKKLIFIKEEIEKKTSLTINNHKIKSLLITEEKLYKKFKYYINKLTEKLNLNILVIYISEGDFFKQDCEVKKIQNFLLENNFEKNSIIIGLGGGKITDLSGFIASTFFRGISLILIPTNLLSMVDASIGGKTGINHLKYGKNVIGTITQPES